MSTFEVTVPDEVVATADEQVARGRFASRSEYVRSLIEADRKLLQLEAMLVERLEESEEVVMDAADFAQLRQQVLQGRA